MVPYLAQRAAWLGSALFGVSVLTFALGVLAPPPTPEWGAMLNEGRTYFLSDPHVTLLPGLTISLAVLGFNLVGDGVRDALDPRLVGERGLPALRLRTRRRQAPRLLSLPPDQGDRRNP